jgi:CRP-like cAMP-binding protein
MSELLKSVYCFKDLNDSEVESIGGIAKIKDFQKGESIVKEGAVLEHFYVIKDGTVRLSVTLDSGDEMIKADEEVIGRLKAGECFGEFSLLDQQAASANVVAETDITVYQIGTTDFMGLIEQDHGVCRKVLLALLKTLVGRLRKTDKDLVMSRYFERMR